MIIDILIWAENEGLKFTLFVLKNYKTIITMILDGKSFDAIVRYILANI